MAAAFPAPSVTGGPCVRCGFDAAEWNDQDTENTLDLAPVLRAAWADGWSGAPTVRGDLVTGPRHAPDPRSRDAVHDLWHDLLDIADKRAAHGDAVPAQRGIVAQLSASSGGVPKRAVETADVRRRGVIGDRQRTRRHHGRPWQALCLWSVDVVDELVAEGHPIFPGAAGENLSLRGLEWSRLRAGAVVDIGAVRCQLSATALPCAKNNQWFVDGDSRRIEHARHPGWSRWYASVVRPGRIVVGDTVIVS